MKQYLLIAFCLAAILPAQAATPPSPVDRIEIKEQGAAFDGMAFGDTGPYERIVAVAHMRIDPRLPANWNIADLDKAPKDADGMVEYATDLVILRPKSPDHARRILIYDVVNRGNKTISTINEASASDLSTAAQAGNGFLMRQGYTLLWSGWQADIAGSGLVRANFPVATDGAKPITGLVEQEAIFDNRADTGMMILPYEAATLDEAQATLTVREHPRDTPRPLPTSSWSYVDSRTVKIARPPDMDGGAIYELTYQAKNPIVAGLGFAATRDIVGFLRYGQKDRAGNANPLADIAAAPCERNAKGDCAANQGAIFDMAIAFGASQSGRYLRDFLWQGFNTDGKGRKIFDGLIPEIAGGRKTYTNVRWAQPGRFSRQHEDHFIYGDQFPFTYPILTDPVTGQRDGILKRCEASNSCPKIFHVDTSAEFWQADASLVGTDGAGHDIALPGNVRAYLLAGGTHYPSGKAAYCQNDGNPLTPAPLLRALFVAMVDWVAGRVTPPDSQWPSVAGHSLAEASSRTAVGFPDLTAIGMNYTGQPNTVSLVDYAKVPPRPADDRGWPVLVPTTDADGIDRPGIRLPAVAVPLGTYLGWNPRKAGFAEGDLCNLFGSYKPFAKDQAARTAAHDPRLSVAERYTGQGGLCRQGAAGGRSAARPALPAAGRCRPRRRAGGGKLSLAHRKRI